MRSFILQMEYVYFGIPKPDINLFLDVPLDFVKDNLAAGRTGEDRYYLEGKEDIHEASVEFQQRVREVYLEQTLLDPSFHVISCEDDQGKIASWQMIFNVLHHTCHEKNCTYCFRVSFVFRYCEGCGSRRVCSYFNGILSCIPAFLLDPWRYRELSVCRLWSSCLALCSCWISENNGRPGAYCCLWGFHPADFVSGTLIL